MGKGLQRHIFELSFWFILKLLLLGRMGVLPKGCPGDLCEACLVGASAVLQHCGESPAGRAGVVVVWCGCFLGLCLPASSSLTPWSPGVGLVIEIQSNPGRLPWQRHTVGSAPLRAECPTILESGRCLTGRDAGVGPCGEHGAGTGDADTCR